MTSPPPQSSAAETGLPPETPPQAGLPAGPEDRRTTRNTAPWWIGLIGGICAFTAILALPPAEGLRRAAAKRFVERLPSSLRLELTDRNGQLIERQARRLSIHLRRDDGEPLSGSAWQALQKSERARYAKPQSVWSLCQQAARAARGVVAVAVLMIIFWITGVLPTAATALLPFVLFPLLGVAQLVQPSFPGYFVVATQYTNQLIFLFMGTFMLSKAMTRWGLDSRIASLILRSFGQHPAILMLGFVVASGFLSMWITNTATTATLVPTAIAVLARSTDPQVGRFRAGLLLAIAYSATVGGMATLVGTAPNAIYASFAQTLLGHEVSFVEWLSFGLPFVLLFLPVVWLFHVYRFIPRGLRLPEAGPLGRAEPLTRAQWQVAVVFALMVLLWISRREIAVVGWPGWQHLSLGALSLRWINDSAVAMFGALLLFALPVDLGRRVFTLELREAMDISWATLLLFGGGLALGQGIGNTGVAGWIATLLDGAAAFGPHVLLLAVATTASLLTEVTSNTATATMLMPVMFSLGRSLGGGELRLMATAAVATSMAFMSPIGTPPNAIVYGTGYVSMGQMFRAGVALNIAAILIWWGVASIFAG
ncbi:MAG: SLC13/DASS family transporter [Deltaproteobacteria bacterium]|nr:SLC13/DASS family transporter [Deltaproteobacteria bacterium]